MKEYLCVGQIVKPQGVKGEVKVRPFTDDAGRFLTLKTVWLGEGGKPMRVTAARLREGYAYLMLEGVSGRDAAEALRGTELYVDRANAIYLPEGRYFVTDLIGLAVQDEAGGPLGVLTDITQAGGNDVYRVEGERTFLFPALKRAIASVDIKAGCIVLRADVLKEIAVYDED